MVLEIGIAKLACGSRLAFGDEIAGFRVTSMTFDGHHVDAEFVNTTKGLRLASRRYAIETETREQLAAWLAAEFAYQLEHAPPEVKARFAA